MECQATHMDHNLINDYNRFHEANFFLLWRRFPFDSLLRYCPNGTVLLHDNAESTLIAVGIILGNSNLRLSGFRQSLPDGGSSDRANNIYTGELVFVEMLLAHATDQSLTNGQVVSYLGCCCCKLRLIQFSSAIAPRQGDASVSRSLQRVSLHS